MIPTDERLDQVLGYFARYRAIIDDWSAFSEAITHTLPTCLWTNTLRISPQRLADLLNASGCLPSRLPWFESGFKMDPDPDRGNRLEYWAGLYHIQEEVSILPAVLLNPKPGDRVLDLCAAPGNKTALLSVMMQNRGTVVANDIRHERIRALDYVVSRLGLTNVVQTVYNASNYPPDNGLFDHVLADVPCSCEGTSRKNELAFLFNGESRNERFFGLQTSILRKAVQLCRPGGRIVYSTCTYAPEENEQVIDTILQETDTTDLHLRPINIPGLVSSPGLTSWKGTKFHPTMNRAVRIWPHQNDTGGFFVAVLEKGLDSDAPAPGPFELEKHIDPAGYLDILFKRFGIAPEVFEPYRFLQDRSRFISIVSRNTIPTLDPKPISTGLALIRTRMRNPKLTSAASMLLGKHAVRNVVDASQSQAIDFANRTSFEPAPDQLLNCTDSGYVLIRHAGYLLGVGYLYLDETNRVIHSMLPKHWTGKTT